MSKIEFIQVTPAAMQPSAPFSSSDAIAARREKIFIPDSQTTYSFESNDRLTFTLNSTNEMIDGQNSWIEFDLTVAGAGADLVNTQLTQRVLDAGGAHALFKRLQVTLSNGTQIEDIVAYNKLYSIIRHNTISENHVRYVEGPLSGDSITETKYESHPDQRAVEEAVLYTQGNATYTAATGVFAVLGANAEVLTQLQVGDMIRATTAASNFTGVVTQLISNTSFRAPIGSADIAANAITSLFVYKRGFQSARFRAGSTAGIKLKMKPFSNFFTNSKFVPLMFLKNLQFTFELERGALAFKFLAPPGANASITYTITNPKFICSMVTPSEPYLQSALDAYNTPEGLYYPFISYQHNLKSGGGNNTAESLTIPANCRSAKALISAQYLAFSEGVAAESYVNDTISLTPKNLVSQFQVKIGSENYPYARPVVCGDIFNGEALSHLQKALDLHGNISHHNSMVPSDYWAVNTVNAVPNESKRFVMGVPFARDIGSEATGVDLINNDVQLEITRSAAGSVACTFRSWIIYDSALQISRMGTIVYK